MSFLESFPVGNKDAKIRGKFLIKTSIAGLNDIVICLLAIIIKDYIKIKDRLIFIVIYDQYQIVKVCL